MPTDEITNYRHNLMGQQFVRLTPQRCVSRSKQGEPIWECQCECGKLHHARSKDLRKGKVKSCGCLHSEIARATQKRLWREGKTINSRSRILVTWGDRTLSLSEWSVLLGIKYVTLYSRLRAGWSIEKVFKVAIK